MATVTTSSTTDAREELREADEIRSVNSEYHDAAAACYDAKWGIDYGVAAQAHVLGKLRRALGQDPGPLGDCLEIGAGTGYLGLNATLAGLTSSLTCTDISAGMLLTLAGNADRLGLSVATRRCAAEALPFDDCSFDTVLGHAVLHHIPDPAAALRECRRVLRPGGILAIAGEPSENGHRIVAWPKRAAVAVAPAWRALVRAAPATEGQLDGGASNHRLEGQVDVHLFTPDALRDAALIAGLSEVRVSGEELVAGLFGWANRTLEASADPATVPIAWRRYAYHGYLLLRRVDAVLERRLPAGPFYNLLLAARRVD